MGDGQRQVEESLDSAYLSVFVQLRQLLDDVLQREAGLNFTQFRLILLAAEKEHAGQLLSELARTLGLHANVVTQCVDALETSGYVTRTVSAADARAKSICVTRRGMDAIELLNGALRDRLYHDFNPDSDPLFKSMLEQCIYAAALIETTLSAEFITRHRASAALITYSTLLKRIEEALKTAVDASLSECRILQRLAEVGQPMRAVDLSLQLMLPATTITRSATSLQKRGWLVRLSSDVNRQAVFMGVSEKGTDAQRSVLSCIDTTADALFFSKLPASSVDSISRVARVVLEGMRARDSIRRYAPVGELSPIER